MKRVWAQCRKELVQIQRDRLTLALAFLLPLMTLLIFGFAIRLETKNIALVIQDFDHSSLSRSYIERLLSTNQFTLTQWEGSDPREPIDHGIARASVIIPPDFQKRIQIGDPQEIQVLIDGTDVNNARVVRNSIQSVTNSFLQSEDLQPGSPAIQSQLRLWFNPGRKESLFIVPGVFALVLAIYPPLLTSIALVREKEKGTILQVYASSMTAMEFLLGKGLAYMILGLGITGFVMGLGSLLFQMSLVADPLPFLIGTPLMLFTTVSFGLLIGSRASNQNAAVQIVATVGFLTALLLSGFIYPLSNIPFPLSLISHVVPARYYIVLARDAFVRGTGWTGVWFVFPILSALGLFFFRVAWNNLKRMQLPD
jgi:ABC-2 type transport system permease protein